eukprot:scaffold929_cov387-Prasinococcus_capsulatus_cf.AAC.6
MTRAYMDWRSRRELRRRRQPVINACQGQHRAHRRAAVCRVDLPTSVLFFSALIVLLFGAQRQCNCSSNTNRLPNQHKASMEPTR